MRHAGWVAVLIIMVGLTGGIWWLVAGRLPPILTQPFLPPPTHGNVDIHMSKVTIHGVANGKIVWEIEASNFDLNKNQHLHMTGLKRVVMLNGGKEELTLTADALDHDQYAGDLSLQGRVAVAGQGMALRTPAVAWSDWRQQLLIPQRLMARVGDYTLVAPGGAVYDVRTGLLRCSKGILLRAKGNTLRAGSAVIDIAKQSFTLENPVSIDLDVAEMEQWMTGQDLPAIPPIPPGVQQRYREYCNKHK